MQRQRIRRNDPCPCGSGKKYKNCCYIKNYETVIPEKKGVKFTMDDGSTSSMSITAIDSIPTHNANGLQPDITAEQMMDLCLDEIHQALQIEKAGTLHDLIDAALREMDIVPVFTYRQIADRMERDGRFEAFAHDWSRQKALCHDDGGFQNEKIDQK